MVRHGQSEDNVSKIFSRDDTRLTETGIEQIKNARKIIRNYDFKNVYYSPLTRTNETLQHLELEGIPEERIREVNFGKFAGLTVDELVEKYPKESKSWFEDPHTYEVPEGESLNMVYERIENFLEFAIEKAEDIVLVTHEGVIRLICSWVFDDANLYFKFKADNGSISIVSVNDDGHKYIKKLNSSVI